MKIKTLLLYIATVLFAFTSCDDTDIEEIFEDSPNKRTQEYIDEIKTDLIDAEDGWYTEYTFVVNKNTGNAQQVTMPFIIDFKENNRVTINALMEGYEEKESSYSLNFSQQLDLVFDSYSVFSMLMDATKYADFRWQLDSISDGQYYFTSRASQYEGITKLMLKKYGDVEKDKYAIEKKKYDIEQINRKISALLVRDPYKSFFRNLIIENEPGKCKFEYNPSSRVIAIEYPGEIPGQFMFFRSNLIFHESGKVDFETPFVFRGKTITGVQCDLETKEVTVISDDCTGKVIYDTEPTSEQRMAVFYFKWAQVYTSKSMSGALAKVVTDMANETGLYSFKAIQIYLQTNSILLYADPAPDEENNWDGKIGYQLEQLGEDLIRFNDENTTVGFRESEWFSKVYENQWTKFLYDDFLADEQGLYIVRMMDNSGTYLISKSNPEYYIFLERVK